MVQEIHQVIPIAQYLPQSIFGHMVEFEGINGEFEAGMWCVVKHNSEI